MVSGFVFWVVSCADFDIILTLLLASTNAATTTVPVSMVYTTLLDIPC